MHDSKVSKWPGHNSPPEGANRFEYVLLMAAQRRVTENEANEQHRRRAYGEFHSTIRSWDRSYD